MKKSKRFHDFDIRYVETFRFVYISVSVSISISISISNTEMPGDGEESAFDVHDAVYRNFPFEIRHC